MEEKLVVESDEIYRILPHKYPFLLVDRVIDLVPGESATGIKNVTFNEPHFTGHFPGKPVMPGVLIVEAMAQAAGVCIIKSFEEGADTKLFYFMSIEEAKFRQVVKPGDTLHLHVVKTKARSNLCKFSGAAKVNGKLVAEASFSVMMIDTEEAK